MVILGAEPMIVDTGTPANREQWLEDVFSLVEPDDVRWVFLSHDDVDHSGNLDEVMTACPNATARCATGRWSSGTPTASTSRSTGAGGSWTASRFDVGDRTLHALRPPVYDSPTTRGLFDPTTGVYWAVDTFATPLPDPHMGVADLDPEFWQLRHGAVRARRGEPVAHDARPRQVRPLRRPRRRASTSPPSRRATRPVIEGRVHRRRPSTRSASSRRSTRRRCPTSRSSTRSSPPPPLPGTDLPGWRVGHGQRKARHPR